MAKKVILIDGNSLLYRAFFALPPLTTSRGEATNAVYGFAVMLNKVIEEERPDFIAAAFDLPTPTFRHNEYAEYKATRERAPDDLRAQMPLAQELLASMNIPVFTAEGFEADDLLGTLARRAETEGYEALIVSGDQDILQLVTDHISALITRRGITETQRYDPAAVQERFGLVPAQLTDLKSLRGDPTDNISGVPGVGEKTAVALLKQFGSLETLLENLEKIKPPKAASAITTYADQARLFKRLVTIDTNAPAEIDWDKCRVQPPDAPRLKELLQRLEFRGLLKKLSAENTESAPAEPQFGEARIIQNANEAARAAKELADCKSLIISVHALSGSPHEAKAVGVLLAAHDADSCRAGVPTPAEAPAGAGARRPTNIQPFFIPAKPELLSPFKTLLQDAGIAKLGHSLKDAMIHLHRLGIDLAGLEFDGEIASFLTNPLRKNNDLWEVAFDLLGAPMPEPLGGNATPTLFDETPAVADLPAIAQREALRAERIRALHPILLTSLYAQEEQQLFEDVEMPTVAALAEMELAGVSIDTSYLEELSARLESAISEAEKTIFILAGEEFTINSPKQLQHILYEKLQLRKGKRIKTGFSTDAATLAALAEEFEIVGKILEYRELTKLKSTYVDSLPRLVNPRTGRIHPSFNQAITATGRLSCSDPNLQNIPIRTDLGKEIRRAFVAARPTDMLFAADYSQIELRVLAHIAKDEALSEIFAKNLDLHTATACEIFGVSENAVTSEMRRLAKIVNFSIPYGTSPQGLAQRIKVPIQEAREYMNRYFMRFAGVARYMEEIVQQARETGYVTTLLGRRRPLPEIAVANTMRRELAERMAINTPIQGSAADIMKLAMLDVDKALKAKGLTTRLIIQVHDELVFEGPKRELAAVAEIVKEKMEGCYKLDVPLQVEMEHGDNWRDMESVQSS